MWVNFTAHQDNGKKVKMTTRFCENAKIAVLVSKAFLNKLQAEGKDFDFVSYDFAHYNHLKHYSDLLSVADLQKSIMCNPCDYGKYNDIGLNRLHLYM